MTVKELQKILKAEIVGAPLHEEREIHTACGSDMMSDVLAFVKDQSVLITGLNNPQVVRTADMMDMICIVFVRGKRPDFAMINMAQERDIVMMTTPLRMYSACGRLYTAGLQGKE